MHSVVHEAFNLGFGRRMWRGYRKRGFDGVHVFRGGPVVVHIGIVFQVKDSSRRD